MTQYDNTNSGMLARNKNRSTDKHPEYTGSLNVEGVGFWVSAWVNTGRAGSKMEGVKFFSIKINRKEQAARAPANYGSADRFPSGSSIHEDDIPF
jgi:hypothetical protein